MELHKISASELKHNGWSGPQCLNGQQLKWWKERREKTEKHVNV